MASARHCCVCHRYKGIKLEVHHIIPTEKGGSDDFDNTITLCFDCHCNAGHYNPNHPKGSKYSPEELRLARDEWHNSLKKRPIVISELYPNEFKKILKKTNWSPLDIIKIIEEKQQKINELEELILEYKGENIDTRNHAIDELKKGNLKKAEELLLTDIKSTDVKKAKNYYGLGLIKLIEHKYNNALSSFLQSHEIDPQNTQYIKAIGQTYSFIGCLEKAIYYYKKALFVEENSDNPNLSVIVFTLTSIGSLYRSIGKYDKANGIFKKSLKFLDKYKNKYEVEKAFTLGHLGALYYERAEYKKAQSCLEEALAVNILHHGFEHPEIIDIYTVLGAVLDKREDYIQSLIYLMEAKNLSNTILGKENPTLIYILNNLGMLMLNVKNYEEALNYIQESLKLNIKYYGNQHPETAIRYNNIGLVWDYRNKFRRAIKYYQKALTIDTNNFNRIHPKVGKRLLNLGQAYLKLGKYEKAKNLLIEAKQILKSTLPKNHPEIKWANTALKKAKQKCT